MSDCPYCQNSFEMGETCHDGFTMWQGLVGPYYIPSVAPDGTLSWTNTGSLPNPEPVDISGPPGEDFNIAGIVATVGQLPQGGARGVWLVGTEAPYEAYAYLNEEWASIGQLAIGPRGEQGPAGPTGPQGPQGPQGPKGAPGEVTQAEFDALADDVAANAGSISDLNAAIGDLEDAAENKVLYYTSVAVSATTGDIATLSNAAITGDHVLAECVWANPSAITTHVTWTTANGSLVLNGTCSSATTANIVLVKKDN